MTGNAHIEIAFIATSCGLFRETIHLPQHKAAINSFVTHQLVWRTILDDLPGPQHNDAVEVVNRR